MPKTTPKTTENAMKVWIDSKPAKIDVKRKVTLLFPDPKDSTKEIRVEVDVNKIVHSYWEKNETGKLVGHNGFFTVSHNLLLGSDIELE